MTPEQTLPDRLRLKSNMINMGEGIAWGSETALMDEAAAHIIAQREHIAALEGWEKAATATGRIARKDRTMDAKDLAAALRFISREAASPQVAVHMVATMIDGVAGWTDLTPLSVSTEDGDDLTTIGGASVHLHDML